MGERYYVKPEQLLAFSVRFVPLREGEEAASIAMRPPLRRIITSGTSLLLRALPPLPRWPSRSEPELSSRNQFDSDPFDSFFDGLDHEGGGPSEPLISGLHAARCAEGDGEVADMEADAIVASPGVGGNSVADMEAEGDSGLEGQEPSYTAVTLSSAECQGPSGGGGEQAVPDEEHEEIFLLVADAIGGQPMQGDPTGRKRARAEVAMVLEKLSGGAVYGGNTISLRGQGGQYLTVQGESVLSQMPFGVSPMQSLQIEAVGTEVSSLRPPCPSWAVAEVKLLATQASHCRGVRPSEPKRLLCHGDVICLRAFSGKLLRLVPPSSHGQQLLQVSASAACHRDAQHWEILLA